MLKLEYSMRRVHDAKKARMQQQIDHLTVENADLREMMTTAIMEPDFLPVVVENTYQAHLAQGERGWLGAIWESGERARREMSLKTLKYFEGNRRVKRKASVLGDDGILQYPGPAKKRRKTNGTI